MDVETPKSSPGGKSCAGGQARAIALLHFATMPRGTQILVALAPTPVFGLYLWRAIQGMRRLDELEQRIQLEALAIAYPVTLVVLMTLGLLQVVDAISPRYAEFLKIWPVVAWLYVIGVFVARKRYR